MKLNSNLRALAAFALLLSVATHQTAFAKQGATDPIPGTSKGGLSTGGGGGGKKSSVTPTPTPTPVPVVPVTVATLTFSAAGPVNGILPDCIGDYQIDPYYPTLLDMTLNVHVSSLDVADGTLLYVNVVGANGTLYPYTSNAIVIVGGAGSCSEKVFVTLGASVAGVLVTDSFGNIIFAGN